MRKANATHKALFAFTLLFVLIAAFSFTAFRQTKTLCCDASKKCTEAAPKNGGKLLWDDFSRRLVSYAALP